MKTKHDVHKYQYLEIGVNKWQVYKCMLPYCTHRIPADDIVGRMAVCWKCEKEFQVKGPAFRREHDRKIYPRKVNCGCHLKQNRPPEEIRDLLQKLGVG